MGFRVFLLAASIVWLGLSIYKKKLLQEREAPAPVAAPAPPQARTLVVQLPASTAAPVQQQQPPPPPKEIFPKPGMWNFSGTVHDLDQKPLGAAVLMLRAEISELEYKTKVNEQGGFRISVPPVKQRGYGYKPLLRLKGYRPEPVKDVEGVLRLPAPDRRQAALNGPELSSITIPEGHNEAFETILVVEE